MSDVRLIHGDCLIEMGSIDDGSIDLILCDLPYGKTECKWDAAIPFPALWSHYKRVIKRNGAIVLTASQPFASALIMSNPEMFKYEWIWQKTNIGGFMNARHKPLNQHENILVFSQVRTCSNQFTTEKLSYFPQGVQTANKLTANKLLRATVFNHTRSKRKDKHHITTQTGFPKSILQFKSERGYHPTQKPVALFEYLIRTYTNEGETVLDNCSGSGTTGVAAINTGRNAILIEKDADYFCIAQKRIAEAQAQKALFA